MLSFEVTQTLLSVETVYLVRRPRAEEVVYTVRGVLMSPTPKFHLVEGEGGRELGVLTGNFLKTKYEVSDGRRPLASIVFPAVAFKKTLTLAIDGEVFEIDGGVFRGVFQAKRGDDVLLEIAKQLSLRDTFAIKIREELPFQIGLLSAVAIHSRFYEMV
jgi:uncharacterized protein YxjI